MPDPILALMAQLTDDSDVVSLAGTRIYGEMPESDAALMPRPSLVIRHAGSSNSFGNGWCEYGDLRFDVVAYGDTTYTAGALWRAVHRCLKGMAREVREGTLLHWARPAGGPTSLYDPDTQWPFVLSTWQVLLSEVQA